MMVEGEPTDTTFLQYVGDGWTVTVSYSATLNPIYNIKIEYIGEMGFKWKGTIEHEGIIIENSYILC